MVNFAKRLFKGDVALLSVIIVLMLISLLVIFSSTGRLAYNEQEGNTWYYFLRQLGLCVSGLVVMWGMKFFSWRWLYQNVGVLLLVSAGLVALAAFGGENINGAGRWIRIPIIGITFQPSEMAKIAIVLYAAKLLSDFQEENKCSSQVLKYFWAPLVVIGLIFLDNFSTSALVGVVCLVMCWIARVRWQLLAKWLGIGVGALVLLILLGIAFPKIQEAGRVGTIINRLVAWVDKDRESEEGKNYNYQSDQAHIAVAKGGMTGCGPGNSTQRNFLPHPYSDFIYAIIIEEYGLMGGFVILFLYSVILFRVGVIARRIMKAGQVNPRGGPEIFPALMVFGLGFSIVLQALFHMGVNVGALPVTGQTLPLVSMGGTSLWFVCASLGIILNTAYSFSSEGLEEEVKREKRNFFIRKVEVKREGVEEGDFEMERERSEHKRRVKKKVSEEDVFDVWTENDSQDVESGIEDEGREVLKELQRRRRRQYKDNEDFD
jgi:cell division protein FtsW